MTTVIGCDPGLHGAICLMRDGAIIEIEDIPASPMHLKSGAVRSEVDAYALANIIDAWNKLGLIAHAAVERVQAIGSGVSASGQKTGDGAVGAFAFGEAAGTIRGVLSAFFIPIIRPSPQEWRRALRIPRVAKGDKTAVIAAADTAFPEHRHRWRGPRGGLQPDRAEAALIAMWCCTAHGAPAVAPDDVEEQENRLDGVANLVMRE